MPPIAAPDFYLGDIGTTIYAGIDSPSIYPTVANELIVSLPSGSASDYPLQFGRVFVPGAIPGEPEVSIDGTPVPLQQADIKTRHGDGSVKFAVISLILPSIDTTEQVLVIGNKSAGVAPTAEPIANMLSDYDFEATINIAVSGTPVSGAPVSARAMLTALSDAELASETASGGVDSRYWTVGPVCTTVLLCDHTTKAWDIGTNGTKAIRPMFHVQFWPSIGKYHVRHIIEGGDVTKLKDEVGIDVTFTTGQSSPADRLSQASAYLYAATFQSRAYWGGATIPRANVKHGVAYLASTGAMPNYDPSITIVPATITSYASDWSGRSKALGANGYWQKGMSATGGRPDLGLMPKWDVVAMYEGSATMHEIAEAHAELAGSWAFYFREGSDSKVIYGSTPGKGRVISKVSRPTQFMYDNNNNMVLSGADGFTADGTITQSRDLWAHDHAHTPGMFWFQYLTTGSAFWHEKLIQLAAWSQFLSNPGVGYNHLASGSSASNMILNGVQPRGYGWQYRNRARAWWASLDGSAEKLLFEQSLLDAAAMRAGVHDVPGMLVGNPIRDSWNTNYSSWYASSGTASRPNGLHYFDPKGAYTVGQFEAVFGVGNYPDDWGSGAQAGWMRNYVTLCLFHAVELGYTTVRPLAEWVAYQTIAIANSAEPRHIADYIIPDVKSDNTYYQTLGDLYDGWAHNADGAYPTAMGAVAASGFAAGGAPNTYSVTVEAYGSIAAAAIAIANTATGSGSAWGVIDDWHAGTVYYNHDPRYAIIPRG